MAESHQGKRKLKMADNYKKWREDDVCLVHSCLQILIDDTMKLKLSIHLTSVFFYFYFENYVPFTLPALHYFWIKSLLSERRETLRCATNEFGKNL